MRAKSSGSYIVYLTLFFSMCISVLPWSNTVATLMPNWTLLTLMYWSIALPHKVSIGTGFITGLLFDVLTDSLFGQHALIFSIATFLSHTLYSRIRNYPVWQQAVFILFFLFLMQLLSLWIIQFAPHIDTNYLYWLHAFTSALCWPIVFAVLRLTRRRFSVQ